MRKILIVGHARHGKDTVAEMIADQLGIEFQCTSRQIAGHVRHCMAGNMPQYVYASDQECWEDRDNHRAYWHDCIAAYCKENKTAFADLIYAKGLIYCGVRAQAEYDAIVEKYDPVVYWVSNMRKPPESEESMQIKYDPETMIEIPNNFSLEALRQAVAAKLGMHFYSKWVRRMWDLASTAKSWSKDIDCKVGAVVYHPTYRMFSLGYNGFAYSVEDVDKTIMQDKVAKNKHTIHAELNAIANANTNVEGWYMLCTKPPCITCASMLIQYGIAELGCPQLDTNSRWYNDNLTALALLREAGVEVTLLKEDELCL